jgi:hypothetical protein
MDEQDEQHTIQSCLSCISMFVAFASSQINMDGQDRQDKKRNQNSVYPSLKYRLLVKRLHIYSLSGNYFVGVPYPENA